MRPFVAAFVTLGTLIAAPALADAPPSDFEDGTTQGWSMPAPSIGTLSIETGGNPGYCMAATDGAPGATPLLARAPEVFVGDLSGFLALQWDEFVLDHGPATVLSTSVLLRSAAGTVWSSVGTLEVVGAWHVRVVPFVETAWTRRSGSESLSDVLGNVEALFISMDTAYLDHGVLESMVDNIMLVPAVSTSVPAVSAMSWGYAKTSFATAR